MTYTYQNQERSEKINNKAELLTKRKYLRNNSSNAEIVLWNSLKSSLLGGNKFRRQHSISNFILDFYCPKKRLAIEIDGDLHFTKTAIEYDKYRTKLLNEYRIRVIRFTNDDVYKKINYVKEAILKELADHPVTS
jgi:very-short-patch-repair endonuclease